MLLKSFKTKRHFYLYSAWSNQIAQVSEELYKFFTEDRKAEEKLNKAVSLGLLPEKGPKIEIFNADLREKGIDTLKMTGPNMLVLSVTESCNFRCEYCYYSGSYTYSRRHSEKAMSLETAVKAVDWFFGFKRNEYKIGFYGGEPLLKFSFMKDVVFHAKNICPKDAKLIFAITTNGALLNEKVADFLAENKFETFVSLDGPKNIHDRYRKDVRGDFTFDKVWNNLTDFQKRHPKYFSKFVNFNITTVQPDPLREIAEFIERHPKIFENKVPKLSALRKDESNVYEHLGIKEDQMSIDYSWVWDAFIEGSVSGKRPGGMVRAVCEALIGRLHRRAMSKISDFSTRGGQCTPGGRCYVDAAGTLHMCERVGPQFPIGDVNSGYNIDKIYEYLRLFADFVGAQCKNCWATRLCNKCIPILAEGEKLSIEKLNRLCAKQKKDLSDALVRYCGAREQRENCFDWIVENKYDDINLIT